MRQKIIALVGISGVGKTTFLKGAAKSLAFQHLTAGSLIARARVADDNHRDRLRFADIDDNQTLLVEGFKLAKDASASLVILDGHTVIHGSNGLLSIDSAVFAALGIDAMVHLEADPSQILINRQGDSTRIRPALSIAERAEHQAHSLAVAGRIAQALSIPLQCVSHGDKDNFCDFASRS